MMHRTIKFMITISMLFHHGIGFAMNPLSRTTFAVAKVISSQARSPLVANFTTDIQFPIITSQIKADICWKAAYETIEKNDMPGFRSLIGELYPEYLSKQNENHRDLLFTTVFKGKKDMAKLLLEVGANPNTENYSWVFKVTPLMKAVAYGGHASQPHDTMHAITKLLIGYGADLNKVDASNHTALHYAVAYQNLEAVKLLKSLGADQFIKSKKYIAEHFNDMQWVPGVYVYKTPYELAIDRLKYWVNVCSKDSKDAIKDLEAYNEIVSILQPKD